MSGAILELWAVRLGLVIAGLAGSGSGRSASSDSGRSRTAAAATASTG